ncbi:TPA: hypothetical protein ACH3X3_000410 [Trebouxia sp. C0006]
MSRRSPATNGYTVQLLSKTAAQSQSQQNKGCNLRSLQISLQAIRFWTLWSVMMSTAILVSYFVPSNTWQMANTWLLEKKAVHAMLCISLICLMPRGNDRCIHGYGAHHM